MSGEENPLTAILTAIESVRAEIAGLRADLSEAPPAEAALPNSLAPAPFKRGPQKGVKLTEEEKAARKSTREVSKAKKVEFGNAREPSEWRLFTDRIRSVLRDAGYSQRSLGPEAVQFAAQLKEERPDYLSMTDEEILKRRETWAPPSVATPAQKSMVSLAPPPLPPFPTVPTSGFQPVMLATGKRYYVNLATGHAYHRRENGSQGAWAGLFSKTPKPSINPSVPEPGKGGARKSRKQKKRHSRTRKH